MTRRTPKRAMMAPANGPHRPNRSRLIESASEIVARSQPNSRSSGSTSTARVAPMPAELSNDRKVIPGHHPGVVQPAATDVGRALGYPSVYPSATARCPKWPVVDRGGAAREGELAGDDRAQERAQLGVRVSPKAASKRAWAAVQCGRAVRSRAAPRSVKWSSFWRRSAVPLTIAMRPSRSSGQDVAAERRAVHDEVGGEGVDGHGAVAPEARQDRVLGRAQAGGRQAVVVELGDVSGGLTEGQAAALGEFGPGARGAISGRQMRIYAYSMSARTRPCQTSISAPACSWKPPSPRPSFGSPPQTCWSWSSSPPSG